MLNWDWVTVMLSERRAELNVFKDDPAINFGHPNHVIRIGKRLCNEVSSSRLAMLNGNRELRLSLGATGFGTENLN